MSDDFWPDGMCRKCGAERPGDPRDGLGNLPERADPCLGQIPGVTYACCGHGTRARAYILFTNGVRISGFIVDPRG